MEEEEEVEVEEERRRRWGRSRGRSKKINNEVEEHEAGLFALCSGEHVSSS